MMTRTSLFAVLTLSAVASAQPLRNRAEKARDRQDLRQDRRQTADDTMDAARAAQLLRDFDAAAAASDAPRLGAIDRQFNGYISSELRESRVESAQKNQEVREDNRELRGDRREVRRDVAQGKPLAAADDVHDTRRDQVNRADDVRDAANERLSRERLQAIQAQLATTAGRFDAGALAQRRQLYAELVGQARAEVAGDARETAEDHREQREDRRERREDRRQR